MKMSWADNDGIPPNHQMTLKSALLIVTTKILLKLFVPGWALGLTENLRNVDLGFKELGVRLPHVDLHLLDLTFWV